MTAAKNVLVTGASGFIGQATCRALEAAGWSVHRCIREERITQDTDIPVDLSSPASILRLESHARFDAIVHLGGQVGLDNVAEAELFAVNVLSSGCFAYLAKQWDAHMVFASTAIVHGVKSERITGDSPINPDTAYARSKWLAEEMIRSSGARHCILRIGGVFGLSGPSHLGLNRAIQGALQGRSPVRIGQGTALRNYAYVEDVGETIADVIGRKLEGTHVLSGGETMSIGEMLAALCAILAPTLAPTAQEGAEAPDQVIQRSPSLCADRPFREALEDMRAQVLT